MEEEEKGEGRGGDPPPLTQIPGSARDYSQYDISSYCCADRRLLSNVGSLADGERVRAALGRVADVA